MGTPILSFVFTLFLLLSGQVLLEPGQAYALCTNPCMCQWGCYSGCQCPGTNGCKWCAMPDSDNLQVRAAPSDATLDDTVNSKNVPFLAFNSYSVDRLIRRAGTGQCPHNNFRLKITDGENSLKLDEVFLKDYAMPDSLVAFQLATTGKK